MYEFTSEKNRGGQVTIGALSPFNDLVTMKREKKIKELYLLPLFS